MATTGPKSHFKFSRRQRILSSRRFAQIYDRRASAADANLIVYAAANDLDFPRLGLSVGRRHGHAVRRNRIRRSLREAFRLSQHDLPVGFDFILIPRVTDDLELEDYRKSLLALTRQAALRAGESSQKST